MLDEDYFGDTDPHPCLDQDTPTVSVSATTKTTPRPCGDYFNQSDGGFQGDESALDVLVFATPWRAA